MITSKNIDFSIFSISLQQYIDESHPLLSNDLEFIKTRGDGAAEVYETFRANGATIEDAIAHANEFLFLGLQFSLHDMIIDVLEDEFEKYKDLEPGGAWHMALELRPVVSPLLERYQFNDDFEDSDDYERLYVEMVGAIQIHFNEYGI